jgi:hypothetical protein
MVAETSEYVRLGWVVGGSRERLVGWFTARARCPHCYCAVAETRDLASVLEPGLFIIIAAALS